MQHTGDTFVKATQELVVVPSAVSIILASPFSTIPAADTEVPRSTPITALSTILPERRDTACGICQELDCGATVGTPLLSRIICWAPERGGWGQALAISRSCSASLGARAGPEAHSAHSLMTSGQSLQHRAE